MNELVGITERSDPSIDFENWQKWVFVDEKPAILISKDPMQMFELLKDHPRANVIVHCTITGLSGTVLEPNTPNVRKAIAGFWRLAKLLGPNRVVLRIDPIFPYGKYLAKAVVVHKEIAERWKEEYLVDPLRVRISFIDIYPHVRARFAKMKVAIPWGDSFHAPLARRNLVWRHLGQPEVCGEPGIEVIGCVSNFDLDVLGVKKITTAVTGQRRSCTCLAVKHELQPFKGRCKFRCLYCYWRDS